MNMKLLTLILNLAGGALALASAWYWYVSTKSPLPPVDPATGKPTGPVGMFEINKTLYEGAVANKKAAFWTAASALVLGLSAILSSACGS
jgi:hypothetical protein